MGSNIDEEGVIIEEGMRLHCIQQNSFIPYRRMNIMQLQRTKKQLGIMDIIPSWFGILARYPVTPKKRFRKGRRILDITDCKRCVVGEAYGFEDNYSTPDSNNYCGECNDFAIDFGSILETEPEVRIRMLQLFADHWNKYHKETTNAC